MKRIWISQEQSEAQEIFKFIFQEFFLFRFISTLTPPRRHNTSVILLGIKPDDFARQRENACLEKVKQAENC